MQGDCAAPQRLLRVRYGAGRLAEAIASFLSTPLVELDLEGNIIEDCGGRTLAETVCLNTTLTSLNLNANGLGEGSGRSLASARPARSPT